MQVQKRNGKIVEFNKNKIIRAISKSGFVPDDVKARIADEIAKQNKDIITIEEIQDLVEKKLMTTSYKSVAKEYIRYRYKREMIRQNEHVADSVLDIINYKNDYVKGENSNKNPAILSTQRDYMAGEVSKDIAERLILPEEIVQAHKAGIIHVHDMDYLAQHMHNCCLVNLEDMLQNGTVISNTLIEKPHSFATACNVATQIMAQVASNQYGGQSESLAHLAPFVDISRQRIKAEVTEELKAHTQLDGEQLEKAVNEITEGRVKEEIKKGVQTIQYQINTLMTSNG